MTIRKRLTLLFALLLAGIGLIQMVIEVAGMSGALRTMAQSDALTRVEQIQSYLSELHGEKMQTHEPFRLDTEEALPGAFYNDGLYIQLSGVRGKIRNKSPNLGSLAFVPVRHPEVKVVELNLPHLFYSPKILLVTRPFVIAGRTAGWIQVGCPLQSLNRAFEHVLVFQLCGWLLGIFLALGVGSIFANRAMRPIRAITEEVNHWDPHDLSRRLSAGEAHDEIYELVTTFNRLFERIEGAFETQHRFVADASHELKSPLTAIKGNLQLMERLEDAPLETRREWIRLAVKEANRLIRITRDLLELARFQGDEQTFSFRALDLVQLGTEVAQSYPSVQVLPHAPIRLWGDEDRLRQALINLLENARRATADLEAPEIALEWEEDPEEARMRIRDNGIGIPAEALPRLFDRFYRVDKARSRAQGGTGLGLAITQAIVEAHGGSIRVESTEGVGTTFELRFPKSQQILSGL